MQHFHFGRTVAVGILGLGLSALLLAGAASAETLLGKHGDWEAFTETEAGKTACYMGAVPTKSRGKYTTRGRTYMLITHRPAENSKNVVSIQAGYEFKKGSEVEIEIGTATFKLFTDGRWAFAPDAAADSALVSAMIRGATMVVKGVSSRGTETTDTYSLTGFTAAHRDISRTCKV